MSNSTHLLNKLYGQQRDELAQQLQAARERIKELEDREWISALVLGDEPEKGQVEITRLAQAAKADHDALEQQLHAAQAENRCPDCGSAPSEYKDKWAAHAARLSHWLVTLGRRFKDVKEHSNQMTEILKEQAMLDSQEWLKQHSDKLLATAQAEIKRLQSLRGNVLLQRDVERLEAEIERLKGEEEFNWQGAGHGPWREAEFERKEKENDTISTNDDASSDNRINRDESGGDKDSSEEQLNKDS